MALRVPLPPNNPLGVFGIQVKLPDFFARFCVQCVKPTVTAGEIDLSLAVDDSDRGRTPLTVQNFVERLIVFPQHFASVLVDRQETGSSRRGNLKVGLIDTIGGDNDRRCLREPRANSLPGYAEKRRVPQSCRDSR